VRKVKSEKEKKKPPEREERKMFMIVMNVQEKSLNVFFLLCMVAAN